MKFRLNNIKLWFKNESEPKIYNFLPNKINVITGDATTGKTSFLSVIDYCLLSNKNRIIEKTINENVSWYLIDFHINGKSFVIARKAANSGTVSSEIFFSDIGDQPEFPYANATIDELREILNTEFGVSTSEDYLLNNLKTFSYRQFLLFTSISADIIITTNNYFDRSFYEIDTDETLEQILLMSIGVDRMENMKNKKKLDDLNKEIATVTRRINSERKKKENIDLSLFALVRECKENNLLSPDFETTPIETTNILSGIVEEYTVLADNEKTFSAIDGLNKQKREVSRKINSIERYKKEIADYNKNLSSYEDSLKPIEYINENFNEIIKSHEVLLFVGELEKSLSDIKRSYLKSDFKTFTLQEDLEALKQEQQKIVKQIADLPKVKPTFSSEATKYIFVGTIKQRLEQIEQQRNSITTTEVKELERLVKESEALESLINDIDSTKFVMSEELDNAIQRNYDLVNSMPNYEGYKIRFSIEDKFLKLKSPSELFEIETVGSSSNYMFLHLCFYLGLHEHMIKIEQKHVPQFLFIDQPSFPYYSGEGDVKNNDKAKLLDAFSLLNSFIKYIVEELKNEFQIFMVEHAPKEYWEQNDMEYFHTVDEFIGGNGMVPLYAQLNNDPS